MTLIKTFLLVLALGLVSCNSGAKATAEATGEEANKMLMDSKKMMEEGYMSGTIVYSEAENDCAYVIDVDSDDYSYMLDPVNMDDGFEQYKKDGMKVWFKFAGLRMPNRCDKASPVNLIEVKTMQ